MKKMLLVMVVTFIVGCSTEDEEICCTIVDIGVSIKYVNEEGENLLDQEDGMSEGEISIYHKINGQWSPYFDGNMDSPKGITTVEREDGTYLVIFPSTTLVQNEYSETKIEFSNSESDILRTEIDTKNSNTIVTKVWYNGELKWQGNQTERMFEILK